MREQILCHTEVTWSELWEILLGMNLLIFFNLNNEVSSPLFENPKELPSKMIFVFTYNCYKEYNLRTAVSSRIMLKFCPY